MPFFVCCGLWPLFITAVVMTCFGVLGMFVVRRPVELLSSLVRAPVLAWEGDQEQTFTIPAAEGFNDPPQVELDVHFRRDEILALRMESDQQVKLGTDPFDAPSPMAMAVNVVPGEPTGSSP